MGADSFSRFHEWKERDDMMSRYVIAVVDRPGYTEAALTCPTVIAFRDMMIDLTEPDVLHKRQSGWCFLNNPKIDCSSSEILQQFAEGKTDFTAPFADVADYIYENGLYNTSCKAISSQSMELAP